MTHSNDQFDIRVATAIGRIVTAYGKVDQQIYYRIWDLKAERIRRAREKASTPPPRRTHPTNFQCTRVKLYRRLCRDLSDDDPALMHDVEALISRLKAAVDCRDDLVHGWVSEDVEQIGLPDEQETRIRVINAHDLIEFTKALRNHTPPGRMPMADDYINITYTFKQLEAVAKDFTELYWDFMTLTEHAITAFR